MPISIDSEHIKIDGYPDTWRVISFERFKLYGWRVLFELISEKHGIEATHLIVTEEGHVVFENLKDGFAGVREILERW